MLELIIISQILGGVAGAIIIFWASFYFYKMYVNKKLMNEIKRQQSRVSVLKLMLRARLRKNSNSMINIFKGEKILLETFQEKYGALAGLDLGSADHYQKIILTLNEIANECDRFFEKKFNYAANELALQNSSKKNSDSKDKRVLEYEHVIKFELPGLLMIREIIICQTSSRQLIERYNVLQDSKREMIKMPIEFKVDDQDVLFDLINRAHEQKKLDKASEIDRELDPSALVPNTDEKTNLKSA